MSQPDPIRQFQSAALRLARHCAPGVIPGVANVLDISGRQLAAVVVPMDAPDAIDPTPGPRPGWDFSGSVPLFDGTPVPISGRKLGILRILATATGPLHGAELRGAWDGYQAEESTIRWTIGDLRKTLKALFPGLDEPIETSEAGYVLTIR